jgi:hypothetical protein
MIKVILVILLALVQTTPLDDYVSAEDPHYSWRQVENNTIHTLYGGTGY